MTTKYVYTCELLINKDITSLTSIFCDDEMILKWQPNLDKIEYIIGHQYDQDSIRKLYFKVKDKHMIMKETISFMQLPQRIKQIYQLGDVINYCDNHFSSRNNKTIWKMDVIFEFKNQPPTTQEAFEMKTMESMLAFKNFVESI